MSDKDLKGKWSVIFSWPRDFTFVCPTEILDFNNVYDDFAKADCNLVGFSTDSMYAHKAWVETLGDIKFAMLADESHKFSKALGILDDSGKTYRCTFIIDPNLTIQAIFAQNLSVGRNAKEIIRTVQAFQTGELCPANWHPGSSFIKL
jgi:peroxiredoxin (alkyl hydroperoxide reductase subunit C)